MKPLFAITLSISVLVFTSLPAAGDTRLDALQAATADTDSHQAVDSLREAIEANRSSKKAPKL